MTNIYREFYITVYKRGCSYTAKTTFDDLMRLMDFSDKDRKNIETFFDGAYFSREELSKAIADLNRSLLNHRIFFSGGGPEYDMYFAKLPYYPLCHIVRRIKHMLKMF